MAWPKPPAPLPPGAPSRSTACAPLSLCCCSTPLDWPPKQQTPQGGGHFTLRESMTLLLGLCRGREALRTFFEGVTLFLCVTHVCDLFHGSQMCASLFGVAESARIVEQLKMREVRDTQVILFRVFHGVSCV